MNEEDSLLREARPTINVAGEDDPRAATFLQLARRMIERLGEIGPQTGPRIDITD